VGGWVIAETADLGTKFCKIVVTNDHGQYLRPVFPKRITKFGCAATALWTQRPLDAMPGKKLALTALIAPTPQAAQSYPANYWVSLRTIPRKSDFPMQVPLPPPIT
jgi:hypothetical protein